MHCRQGVADNASGVIPISNYSFMVVMMRFAVVELSQAALFKYKYILSCGNFML
jgi:hypothetical protein